MTHPFHPLAGAEFQLVVRKHTWAEDRVFFFDDDGQVCSLPAGWTDVDPPEPFEVVSAGRSVFRVGDLLALVALIENLRPPKRRRRVKPSSPRL